MGYAIAQDGGWRQIGSAAWLGPTEQYSEFPLPPRPSQHHVFTGQVSVDPAVCWRQMTQAEIDAQKDAMASQVANGSAYEDVVKAAFLVVLDGVNTLRGLHGLVAVTPAQFKQAIISKLPNP